MIYENFIILINAIERASQVCEHEEINLLFDLVQSKIEVNSYKLSQEECDHLFNRLNDADELIKARNE